MKKSLSLILLAAALLGVLPKISAAPIILYTEDWGTTNGGKSFAAVGWSVVSAMNPPYVGFYSSGTPTDSASGNPLPAETVYYTSLAAGQNGIFYTVAGAGAGTGGDSAFNAIDPTQFQSVTLSVEASDEGSTATNYFAVQVGGAWYVSATALKGSDPTYPAYTLTSTPYTTAASAWNQLTINTTNVTIGSAATTNLSGPITGIGIVQVGPGGWNYNEIIISATPSPIVYTEDWGTTNGGKSFAAVGWTAVSAMNPPYLGFYSSGTPTDSANGNPLPPETVYYTSLAAGQNGIFYTVAGSGAGTGGDTAFNAIDPTVHTSLTLSVEASDEGSTATNYFAVQVGGAWYVSTTALKGSDPTYPAYTLTSTPYTTTASAWNQLTINTTNVTIGSAATSNLTGLITGIGIVQVGPGGWNYNEIIISDVVPSTVIPPSATIYAEDWGTPYLNATGTQNGAADLADVGWSASGIAYTGSYAARGSIDPGTGVTFPPPPLGNINGTNNAIYASLDQTDGYIGILYTTDTNGAGTVGDTSFTDINPSNYPGGVVLNMESQFNSTTHASNFFAVQIGAVAGVGGQWYVSTNGFTNNAPSNPFFMHNSLVFNPSSNNWDTLTFQQGAVNAAGSVTIGGQATNNLSGSITGVGIVVVGNPAFAGGTTGYGINFATFSVTTPLVNPATNTAPKIDAPGFSQTAYAGGTASFAVDAFVGTAPLTYTWTLTTAGGSTTTLKNGATGTGSFIIGATSNFITISNVGSADAGSYSVAVTNSHGADYSTNYTTNTLTVNPLPIDVLYAETFPFVGPFPAGETPAAVGWMAAVSVTDNPNRLDDGGSLYAYETTATTMGFFTSSALDVPGLSGVPFTNINPSNFSAVSFRATIADPTSDTTTSIYFAVQMTGGQWYASSASIQLSATPAGFNTYGLQFNPAALEWNTLTVGAGSATIGSVATANLTGNIIGAGVVFAFTGTAAEYELSNFELVTDLTPPVLATFPSLPDVPYPQTVYAGGGASFYFTEAGTLPLTNNWQFNNAYLTNGTTATGSIISGAQTTELTIQNAGSADAGAYDPFVSNPAGTTDLGSSPNDVYGPPNLTVTPPPLGLIYNESFPLYKPATANQPLSIVGWTNQSDTPNRIYQTGSALLGLGAAYAYESTQTNSLFYASTATDTGFSGLPFIAFNPANYPAGSIGFSASMEAGNAAYTNASASFAVEQGGQWYTMVTPVQPTNGSTLSTTAFTALGPQIYSPLASQWQTLTLVGTAGVIVGGTPAQNLSGPITAAGLLFQHFGTAGASINYDSFTIQATSTVSSNLVGGLNIGPLVSGSAGSANSFTLTWVGNPAVNLQSSTDLLHWADVTNTLGNYMLTVSATGTHVFYRLIDR